MAGKTEQNSSVYSIWRVPLSLVHMGVKQEQREQWALEMSLTTKGLPLCIFFGQTGLASYGPTVCQIIAICFICFLDMVLWHYISYILQIIRLG